MSKQIPPSKLFMSNLRKKLGSAALPHFQAALKGGPGDEALFAAPKALWPAITLGLYLQQAPPDAVREALTRAWADNSIPLARLARAKGCLMDMFRYAAFPIPHDFPDPLTIWRGTAGVDRATAQAGLSWTTHRAAACYWAVFMSERTKFGAPLVITREVRHAEVVFVHDHELMSEVVFDAAPASEIDGIAEEWREEAVGFSLTYEEVNGVRPELLPNGLTAPLA